MDIEKRIIALANEYKIDEWRIRNLAIEHGLAAAASTLANQREIEQEYIEPDGVDGIREQIIEDCRAEIAAKRAGRREPAGARSAGKL